MADAAKDPNQAAKPPDPVKLASPVTPAMNAKEPSIPPPKAPVAKPGADKAAVITKKLEDYVQINEATDPSVVYQFEGVCKKCGWHTEQLTRNDAVQLVRQHVQGHWHEVQVG